MSYRICDDGFACLSPDCPCTPRKPVRDYKRDLARAEEALREIDRLTSSATVGDVIADYFQERDA